MAALPKSPHGRRSSSGGGLRPVLPFALDDGSAVEIEEDDGPEMEPPREGSAFAGGAGVDEVEYAYGFVFISVDMKIWLNPCAACNARLRGKP
jgi:hypothetical protein